MPEIVTRSDGIKLELPDINVSNTWNCSHHVSVDGIPMDTGKAIRYLLADRARILTLLADVREELEKLR